MSDEVSSKQQATKEHRQKYVQSWFPQCHGGLPEGEFVGDKEGQRYGRQRVTITTKSYQRLRLNDSTVDFVLPLPRIFGVVELRSTAVLSTA